MSFFVQLVNFSTIMVKIFFDVVKVNKWITITIQSLKNVIQPKMQNDASGFQF